MNFKKWVNSIKTAGYAVFGHFWNSYAPKNEILAHSRLWYFKTTYQNYIEMTSNMIYIVALGGGIKCPGKIHLNTRCPLPLRFSDLPPALVFSLREQWSSELFAPFSIFFLWDSESSQFLDHSIFCILHWSYYFLFISCLSCFSSCSLVPPIFMRFGKIWNYIYLKMDKYWGC